MVNVVSLLKQIPTKPTIVYVVVVVGVNIAVEVVVVTGFVIVKLFAPFNDNVELFPAHNVKLLAAKLTVGVVATFIVKLD